MHVLFCFSIRKALEYHLQVSHHIVLVFGASLIPLLVIVLINPRNDSGIINFYDHAYMTLEFETTSFDRHNTVWSHDVLRLAANP